MPLINFITDSLLPTEIAIQVVQTGTIAMVWGPVNELGVTYRLLRNPNEGTPNYNFQENRVVITGLHPGREYEFRIEATLPNSQTPLLGSVTKQRTSE